MSRDTSRTQRTGRSREDGTRPKPLLVLIGALTLQGLSGVGGGLGLSLDPSGDALGIPLEWLRGSPFPDYLIPGVVLLAVLGIGPLFVAYAVWARRRWSWSASLVVAVGVFVWLAAEIAVIGYQPEPPLQLIYGIVALAILLAALAPSVRNDLRSARGRERTSYG